MNSFQFIRSARLSLRSKDAEEYCLTVAEMVTHIHDSHGRLISPVYQAYMGAAPPPVYTRIIEGEPVITGFRNETAAKAAGIEIGDVVLKMDGENMKDRIARLSKYIPASTLKDA